MVRSTPASSRAIFPFPAEAVASAARSDGKDDFKWMIPLSPERLRPWNPERRGRSFRQAIERDKAQMPEQEFAHGLRTSLPTGARHHRLRVPR